VEPTHVKVPFETFIVVGAVLRTELSSVLNVIGGAPWERATLWIRIRAASKNNAFFILAK
jgi:hypothetical protein